MGMCVSIYVHHVQDPQRALDALELELRVVVSCQVGSENQTQSVPFARAESTLNQWAISVALRDKT